MIYHISKGMIRQSLLTRFSRMHLSMATPEEPMSAQYEQGDFVEGALRRGDSMRYFNDAFIIMLDIPRSA